MLTKPYNCPLLRLALLGLCVIISATCFRSEAWATPPYNWEVLRVFIEDDTEQVNKLVTGNYKNIRLDDLEEALAKHNNLRKALPLREVALEDAIYVARLDGESILSDQSRWKLTGVDTAQPLVLENISLPLRAARYIAPSSKQLTEFAVYSPGGDIELPTAAEGSDYWFGFSIHSQEQKTGRVFTFRIPPAVTAKLLLATPPSIELSSPTLVVEKVLSLASQLPGDWSSTTPQVGSGSQWWLVHLSGVSQFELSAKQSSETDLTRFSCLANSAVVEYVVSPQNIAVRASFSVAGHRASAPLRILASRDFRIETVLVNGLPISWRFEPSLAENTNLIELSDLHTRSDEVDIELHAICHLDTSRAIELPVMALAEAYAMDGKTRVFARGGLVVESLAAQSASGQGVFPKRVLRPPVEASNGDVSSAFAINRSSDEPFVWQASWLGSQPQFVAQFSQQRKPTAATSLTRFSIQDEWLAANCRLRIESSQIQSNEFQLPVGDGWFIDSVRLIGAEPFVRVRLEDRIDAANPIIVIHWEGDRQQLSIDLEVLAHSPQEMNSGLVSLRSPRLVTLPEAEQVDNYAIETSSRFAVQVGPKLLPYQRQPMDLPKWQQNLVPDHAKPWIFQGVRGKIPPINLVATSGSFTSSILTVLHPSPLNTRMFTRIDCTPISGSIDRLSISLPPGANASDWKWSLHQPGQLDEHVVLNSLPLKDAGGSSDEQQTQTVELELPAPQAIPFVLACELQFDTLLPGAELRIPIVGIPAAVGEKSLLLMPPELAQSLSDSTIELLPDSSMADHLGWSELASHIPYGFANQQDEVHVAVRLDAAVSQWLTLSTPAHPLPQGWVWSETLRHTLSENGRVEHDVRWVVEGDHLNPLEVTLPEGWSVDQVWIDEVLTDHRPSAQHFQLQLLRQGRAMVRICCSSQHARPGWLSYVPTQRPNLSLPILASRTASAIPPSRLAVRNLLSRWGTLDAQSHLVDRLLPRLWWKLLLPFQSTQPIAINSKPLVDPTLPAGWSSIESSSNTLFPFVPRYVRLNASATSMGGKGEWTISRSAFSAMIIALVMIMATIFWSCLKVSLWRWWVATTLSVLCVVLVPAWLLAPAQLVLLALGLAVLLRLCMVVFTGRSNSTKPRGRSSVLHSQPSISTTSAIVLICLGNLVNGQSVPNPNGSLSPTNLRFENQIAEGDREQQPEIFSVLIPVDESGEVAGEYAYAPTRMLDFLEKGGNVTSREVPPKIRSSEYTLRMRRGLANSPDQVQELFVDLQLQVAQVDTELRLPFDSRQLQLQSGSVGEQELYVGGRSLYQLPDAIVFRPYSIGNLRLRLHFEPLNIEFSETQAELRCSIPTLPTATLRIIADSSSNFQVLSSGTGRKTITTEYTELLGPVSELEVIWSPSSPRSMVGQNSAEVFADTWLYARGGQVSAICQLRIENARSLPRDMKVVAEPGWEPVGLSWEYGELLANEVSAMGGRRVYTIRGNDGWDQLSRRALRVLMVPRNEADLSSLSVPFLSLRDVSPLTPIRTLAWSAEEGAAWQPDGLDLWQELKYMPGLEWGKFNWRVRPQLFRMAGTLATSLRPSSSVAVELIDEMTQLRLSQAEATLTYRGQFNSPQPQALSLIIPRQARVDRLFIDGIATNYRRAERGEQATIEILTDDRPTHGREVDLAISQPLELGQPLPAPRVFVRGSQASRSVYRVLCGAGLECHLTNSDDLKLNPVTLLPREQLAALETMVGQIDLGNSYRELPALPIEMEVRPRPEIPVVGSVLALEQSEQGWQATLTTQWESGNQPLDFVFFELPSSILDSIEVGQLPTQFTTHGDSGRMTMSLLAPPPVSGITEVEFSFTIPSTPTSQSMAIPHISILTESPSRPLLALPDSVDGQKVAWSPPGHRLDSPPRVSLGKAWLEGYQFFEVEPATTQVSWKRFQAVDRNAQLLVSRLTLLDHQLGRIAGVADYWLSPHGQKDFSLTLPEHCQVLGVDIGGRPALWSQEQRQLNILLQPNFLPLVVRVLLQWETNNLESMALALPLVVNADANEQTLQFVENHLPNLRVDATLGNSIKTSIQQEVSQLWMQLVVESFQTIRKRSPHETRRWLELWNPSLIGIDNQIVLQPDQPTLSVLELSPVVAEEPVSQTANDLWLRMCELLQPKNEMENDSESLEVERAAVPEGEPTDEWPAHALTPGPREFIRLANQPDKLTLMEVATVSGWTAQWIAAGMLATAAILVVLLAKRLGSIYLKLINVQPWVYWLQLGVVAWFLLPLTWPSWVLVATAAGLLATQLIQNQRRQRSFSRT